MEFPLSVATLQCLTTTVNPNLIKLCLLFPEFTRSNVYLKNTKKMLTKVITENNTKYYYYFNKIHREDGPAIENVNGTKMWWINGIRHREDGPAVECKGTKKWYINDELHREDGPAVEWVDGNRSWYINGKCVAQNF